MNRNEKLKLLQSIKDKKMTKSLFLPPKTYVFFEHTGEVNQYIMEGKIFSLKEYEMFSKQVETDNKIQQNLGFRNTESIVITVQYVRNQTIL